MSNATVITVMIRKGGSAKTTTAINLAKGLAKQGKRVLLIDADSQGNVGMALGIAEDEQNLAGVLGGKVKLTEAIKEVAGLYLLMSGSNLSEYEARLTAQVNLYEAIKKVTPDDKKAAAYVEQFSFPAWCETLRSFVGAGAETMIAQEAKEGKYNKATHAARFAKIRDNWEEIVKIIDDEIPSAAQIEKILVTIGIEPSVSQLDLTSDDAKVTFRATKDIRDKYVLSRLAWDLGVIEELCDLL